MWFLLSLNFELVRNADNMQEIKKIWHGEIIFDILVEVFFLLLNFSILPI